MTALISPEVATFDERNTLVLEVSIEDGRNLFRPLPIFLLIQDTRLGQWRLWGSQLKPRIRGDHLSLHGWDGLLPHVLGNASLNGEIVASIPGTLRRVMGNHQRS